MKLHCISVFDSKFKENTTYIYQIPPSNCIWTDEFLKLIFYNLVLLLPNDYIDSKSRLSLITFIIPTIQVKTMVYRDSVTTSETFSRLSTRLKQVRANNSKLFDL